MMTHAEASTVELQPVEGALVDMDGSNSRKLFNDYNMLRAAAEEINKVDGPQLAAIREEVGTWVEAQDFLTVPESRDERIAYYTEFSRERAAKILELVDHLEARYENIIAPVELAATRAFIESTFAMYEAKPVVGDVMPDQDGSFAFIVPCRMSRNSTEYGKEVEPVIPAFRYLPMELRSQMLVGLPPFVVAEYMPDEAGKQGRIIFAPVTEDLREDFTPQADGKPGVTQVDNAAIFEVARRNTAAAADFAYRRFGIQTVGLGATLPSLTHYGNSLKQYSRFVNDGRILTTTGHGGTAELISMTVEAALHGQKPESLGVLGVGAIGAAVVGVFADRYPGMQISIADINEDRLARTQFEVGPARAKIVRDLRELLAKNQVVVSAILGEVDLDAIYASKVGIVIDDCQPGSMKPKQVAEHGGSLLWVIGSTADSMLPKRIRYAFGRTVIHSSTDAFGCELEAASLARYRQQLENSGMSPEAIQKELARVAIRSALKPAQARRIGSLFRIYGVRAARPQAFGQPINV